MPPRISKVQRWLDLLSYLIGRRFPVPVADIMERVPAYAERWSSEDGTARATALRTFERDKDGLRRLGIPLETITYTINYGMEEVAGYRLSRRDFYLPYLRLLGAGETRQAPSGDPARIAEIEIAPEDATYALDALQFMASLPGEPLAAAASSAFRKLAFDLEPAGLYAAPVIVRAGPAAEQGERVALLSEALQARRLIAFEYRGIHRDQRTRREVEPYGVIYQGGAWYLVAYDPGRDGMRLFRLDRMEHLRCARDAPDPDYEIPASFRLQDYVQREAWELGDRDTSVTALVRFAFPLSVWAGRNGYGTRVEELEEGAAVHRFEVRQADAFLRWVLTLEGEAEVLSPPELRAELETMARSIAGLYRDTNQGSDGEA